MLDGYWVAVIFWPCIVDKMHFDPVDGGPAFAVKCRASNAFSNVVTSTTMIHGHVDPPIYIIETNDVVLS